MQKYKVKVRFFLLEPGVCFSPAGSTSGKAVDATELTAAPSPIFDLLGGESAFSPTEKDIGYLQKSAKTIKTLVKPIVTRNAFMVR